VAVQVAPERYESVRVHPRLHASGNGWEKLNMSHVHQGSDGRRIRIILSTNGTEHWGWSYRGRTAPVSRRRPG